MKLSIIFFSIMLLINTFYCLIQLFTFNTRFGFISVVLVVVPIIFLSLILFALNSFSNKTDKILPLIYFLFLFIDVFYLFTIEGGFKINEGVRTLNVLFFLDLPLYINDFLKKIGLLDYTSYFISQIIVPPLYLFIIIRLSMYVERKFFLNFHS